MARVNFRISESVTAPDWHFRVKLEVRGVKWLLLFKDMFRQMLFAKVVL